MALGIINPVFAKALEGGRINGADDEEKAFDWAVTRRRPMKATTTVVVTELSLLMPIDGASSSRSNLLSSRKMQRLPLDNLKKNV